MNYTIGQIVIATSTVQGMKQGFEYRVVSLNRLTTFAGTFTTLTLAEGPDNVITFEVRNPERVVKPAPVPPVTVRIEYTMDSRLGPVRKAKEVCADGNHIQRDVERALALLERKGAYNVTTATAVAS